MIPWNYVFDQIPTQEQVGPYRKFDPAEGKKLLAAAGQDKMVLDSINYYQTDQTVGYYVNALKEQGITLNNKNLDLVSFSAQWQQSNYAEVAGGTATGANFYADIYFKDMILTNSGGNRWNLSDPEIDQWADAQSVEVDPKKRRELLKKIWDKLEQKAYRPLETPQATGAALPWQPYVMGWRPTRASNPSRRRAAAWSNASPSCMKPA